METVPIALPLPAVPVVRPIIGTNTYRQVCTILVITVLIDVLTVYKQCVVLFKYYSSRLLSLTLCTRAVQFRKNKDIGVVFFSVI